MDGAWTLPIDSDGKTSVSLRRGGAVGDGDGFASSSLAASTISFANALRAKFGLFSDRLLVFGLKLSSDSLRSDGGGTFSVAGGTSNPAVSVSATFFGSRG